MQTVQVACVQAGDHVLCVQGRIREAICSASTVTAAGTTAVNATVTTTATALAITLAIAASTDRAAHTSEAAPRPPRADQLATLGRGRPGGPTKHGTAN